MASSPVLRANDKANDRPLTADKANRVNDASQDEAGKNADRLMGCMMGRAEMAGLWGDKSSN